MCHVHSPRKGDAIPKEECRVRSVQDARHRLEGPDIVRKRWAEPRSLCEPHGGGSPRPTRTQAVSGKMRVEIRTSRHRRQTDEPSRWTIAGVFCCPSIGICWRSVVLVMHRAATPGRLFQGRRNFLTVSLPTGNRRAQLAQGRAVSVYFERVLR